MQNNPLQQEINKSLGKWGYFFDSSYDIKMEYCIYDKLESFNIESPYPFKAEKSGGVYENFTIYIPEQFKNK